MRSVQFSPALGRGALRVLMRTNIGLMTSQQGQWQGGHHFRNGFIGRLAGQRSTCRPRLSSVRSRMAVCPRGVKRTHFGCWYNGFKRPVLKHGPRSLTCMRVFG